MKKFVAVPLFALSLAACTPAAVKNKQLLELGMDGKQVREIMGKPDSVRSYNCNGESFGQPCKQTWYYKRLRGSEKVRFVNGKVAGY